VEICGDVAECKAPIERRGGDVWRGSTTFGLGGNDIHPLVTVGQEVFDRYAAGNIGQLRRRGAPDYREEGSVNACLGPNGAGGRAAAYLAGPGARLDLEGAAGVDQIDV